jgi:hypothetical protein
LAIAHCLLSDGFLAGSVLLVQENMFDVATIMQVVSYVYHTNQVGCQDAEMVMRVPTGRLKTNSLLLTTCTYCHSSSEPLAVPIQNEAARHGVPDRVSRSAMQAL